jgi:hypothetical protein
MQTVYADTILNIIVTGGLIRLDLGTVLPAKGEDGQQTLQATPVQQLVMPVDGFVRAFGMQQNVIQKLIKDGVIKTQPAADAAQPAAEAAAPAGDS